jgi:hypothetical protein
MCTSEHLHNTLLYANKTQRAFLGRESRVHETIAAIVIDEAHLVIALPQRALVAGVIGTARFDRIPLARSMMTDPQRSPSGVRPCKKHVRWDGFPKIELSKKK